MSPRALIAIDLGTQSLRVSAIDLEGRRLWSRQQPVATFGDGARQEQDAAAWRSEMLAGLAEAAQAGIVPAAILASGPLAGWVPVAADGAPLGPAVMYNDTRTESELSVVRAALPADAVAPRPTIADPLPHALMLRREAPGIAARAAQFLDATGWLNYVLTGEPTLNSYTAIRLYDGETRERLAVTAVPFGRQVPVGSAIAPLVSALAERFGWPRVPVIAASFDSKCAYLGSGIAAPGEALDISGTVTSFGVVAAGPVRDVEDRIYTVPLGDRHLVRGSTAAAGSVIEWARACFGLDIAELDSLSLAEPISSDDPVFVPYLSGARAPLWHPRARGCLSGLSIATRRPALARTIYAGLALSLRHIVETIESCGAPATSIRLAGGLARSAALSQIKADILSRPVTVLDETELTTFGLAAIGAAALGQFPDIGTAARSFVRDARSFVPRLDPTAADRLYARYLKAAGLSVSLVPPAHVNNGHASAA